MLKKISLLFAVVLCFAAVAVFAQNAPVTGKVELKKADGTLVPVEGAVVEAFRTDIKSAGPADKTDKKGQFSFAGLQLGATFVLSVSAAGASPTYLPGIRPGNASENLKITLDEGDGRKFTADEVRAALAKAPNVGGSSEMTKEQREALVKEQAEYNKKVAEITERNKKAENTNKVVNDAIKAGAAAFDAKDYDLALVEFQKGIDADPEFAGSAPILLRNKSKAYLQRALAVYNSAPRGDAAARTAAIEKAKPDLASAIDALNRGLEILGKASAGEASEQKNAAVTRLATLTDALEAHGLATKITLDSSRSAAANAILEQYVVAETDDLKRTKMLLVYAADMNGAGELKNAVVAYRKVLEKSPDNLDALAGLGLALYSDGSVTDPPNKEVLQEGLNYMQRFVDAAPESHQLKESTRAIIEELKNTQKLAPQKTGSTKRKT